MVTHYRWDFIGLSTDSKPTPATSEKVTDGSTFYCSDNSKLYVWYKNQWYEKTATGGGGGYVLPIASSETLGGVKVGEGLTIDSSTGVLSATGGGGGGGVKILTSDDYNWDSQTQTPSTSDADSLAFWCLDEGYYEIPSPIDVVLYEWTDQPEQFQGIAIIARSDDDAWVSVFITQPNDGGVIRSGMWNQYAPDLYSGSGWTNLATDAMVASAITDHIKVVYEAPDSTTYGSIGQMIVYVNSTTNTARVFVCSGEEQDPITGDYTYKWDEIGSGFGVLLATPTSSTAGVVGKLYRYDTTGSGSYEIWLCLDDDGAGTYAWKQLSLV